MHPDCATGRIRLWASLDPIAAQAFRPVMGGLYDFVVWGMTEGTRYLTYRWGEKEAWMKAVGSYLRKLRLDKAQRAAATETTKLMFLVNARGSNGTGHNSGSSTYPDSNLWVRECAAFVVEHYDESMMAYFLDIIDLFDLAKLCYSGDVLLTKHKVAAARRDLKGWCFG